MFPKIPGMSVSEGDLVNKFSRVDLETSVLGIRISGLELRPSTEYRDELSHVFRYPVVFPVFVDYDL